MRMWRRLLRGLRTGSRWAGWPTSKNWVPHLRDGFIVAKVGPSCEARSVFLRQIRDNPDWAWFVEEIVTIGGPWPILRLFDKASGDWIAVHVLQLFDSLVV